MNTDFTATQMMWKPALLKLTQVPFEQIDDGVPTTLYVDPSAIQKICREMMIFNLLDGGKSTPQMATNIHCCHFTCSVMETPEQVALLRDRALGHEQKPKAVNE